MLWLHRTKLVQNWFLQLVRYVHIIGTCCIRQRVWTGDGYLWKGQQLIWIMVMWQWKEAIDVIKNYTILHVFCMFFFPHHITFILVCLYRFQILVYQGRSWSWSYGSWIYNYLCNWCISPLKVVSLNPVHGEVYLIQHYVINLVRDLRQVSDFLRVL